MKRRPGRRTGAGEDHEARLAVIERRFPETMRARCSWCGFIKMAKEGEWVEVFLSSPGAGVASTHVFRCNPCENAAITFLGSGFVAVPRQAKGTLTGLEIADATSQDQPAPAGEEPEVSPAAEPARKRRSRT